MKGYAIEFFGKDRKLRKPRAFTANVGGAAALLLFRTKRDAARARTFWRRINRPCRVVTFEEVADAQR